MRSYAREKSLMSELESNLLEHADDVWKTIVRIINDLETARDCYQQTFLDAMRLDPTKVRSWNAILRQIATHRAIDALRDKYRRRDHQPIDDDQLAEKMPVDSSLLNEELREDVRLSLSGLPPHQATAFWLRHMEQFSYEEISQHLAISQTNVRVLVHRATRTLRESLGPRFQSSASQEINP